MTNFGMMSLTAPWNQLGGVFGLNEVMTGLTKWRIVSIDKCTGWDIDDDNVQELLVELQHDFITEERVDLQNKEIKRHKFAAFITRWTGSGKGYYHSDSWRVGSEFIEKRHHSKVVVNKAISILHSMSCPI